MFIRNIWQKLQVLMRWDKPFNWPSPKQWKGLFNALSFKERVILTLSLSLVAAGLTIWTVVFLTSHLAQKPTEGGTYTEALVGQPRHINPILAASNPVDRDLTALIFSGLTRYDKNGKIVPDLAERWDILEDGKVYEFHLRPNIFWPDGEPITADDAIFTIQKIQNPAIHNPLLPNWLSVKTEQGQDQLTVKFILTAPYAPFLNNTTVGILPKHMWGDVPNETFSRHELNIKPMGAGMYAITKIERDRSSGAINSLSLKTNDKYWNNLPYIQTIKIQFFENMQAAIDTYNQRGVDAVGGIDPNMRGLLRPGRRIVSATLPRYFGVFFNQTQSKALADRIVRIALSYGTDKNKILKEVWRQDGEAVIGPILPGMIGYTSDLPIYGFDPEHARKMLDEAGWTDSDQNGIRDKKGTQLAIVLTTSDAPELTKTADLLKSFWTDIGVAVNVKVLPAADLREQAIRPRSYEALLYGYDLGADPDPFSFWHSSQRFDPWPNLTLYNNKEADRVLEEARQKFDQERRAELYRAFQKMVVEDAPAIFLVSPKFIYPTIANLEGLDLSFLPNPSWRFAEINNWYLKTKLQWE